MRGAKKTSPSDRGTAPDSNPESGGDGFCFESAGNPQGICRESNANSQESNRFPLMEEALSCGFFETACHFLLDSPTGSGKTHLATELARRETARGRACVIAVPLRALAEELYGRLSRDSGFHRGALSLCTGAARRGRPWRMGALTVCTYESLWMRVNLQHLDWLSSLAFVAVDEIHLLENERGAQLEELMLRLLRLAPFCRILAMSGTLDPSDLLLAQWLDAAYLRIQQRPTPVHLRTEFLPASRRFDRIREILSRDPRPSLIFVHSRRRAALWTRRLSQAGIAAAFHHAGLSLAGHLRVLEGLKSGQLKAVVATPTLEMGVNLPVERVFCPDLVFPAGSGWRRISARTLHQRLGRAGRPSSSPAPSAPAEGVVFAPPGSPDPLDAGFGPVFSRLHEHLDTFILHELADRLCRSRAQLERAYRLSLAARRGEPADWESAFGRLKKLGFLVAANPENPNAPLELTPLGMAAARQFGQLCAFSGSLAILRRECTPFDALWLAFACLETETWLDFLQLRALSHAIAGIPSFLLTCPDDFQDSLGISHREAVCALAAAAAFLAWSETPKSGRENGVYWNTSYETHRLRAWRARRTLDAWIRVVQGLPDESIIPKLTRASLETAREILRHSSNARSMLADSAALALPAPSEPMAALDGESVSEEIEVRLLRALQCRVQEGDDGSFLVAHRGPARRVENNACSCPDFSPQRPCKHVLAVQIRKLRPASPGAFDIWSIQ